MHARSLKHSPPTPPGVKDLRVALKPVNMVEKSRDVVALRDNRSRALELLLPHLLNRILVVNLLPKAGLISHHTTNTLDAIWKGSPNNVSLSDIQRHSKLSRVSKESVLLLNHHSILLCKKVGHKSIDHLSLDQKKPDIDLLRRLLQPAMVTDVWQGI
ncbi:hypothetical protein ANCCEY_06083 [Ancylostoma ceylanicum]|uniref:Uncharacterized protein n=1 Tax=Ancylostoma ceylanicum TaxID=53326 RepID=A0A0D6LRZ2_9BILA|nr:hypothetical protein ANCCEY_06083 [Ancylostoma ceylanicum]